MPRKQIIFDRSSSHKEKVALVYDPISNHSYSELKKITDECYVGKRAKYAQEVLELLSKNGIKCRKKDGILKFVNISIPKSKTYSIVVGLRYLKKDNTFTEDHFVFEKDKPMQAFYKKSLEKSFPEYRATHKLQVR